MDDEIDKKIAVTAILFLLVQNRLQTHDWTLIWSGTKGLGIQKCVVHRALASLSGGPHITHTVHFRGPHITHTVPLTRNVGVFIIFSCCLNQLLNSIINLRKFRIFLRNRLVRNFTKKKQKKFQKLSNYLCLSNKAKTSCNAYP